MNALGQIRRFQSGQETTGSQEAAIQGLTVGLGLRGIPPPHAPLRMPPSPAVWIGKSRNHPRDGATPGMVNRIMHCPRSEERGRFAGDIETLDGHLKAIKSDDRICQRLRKGFFGRQWLFDAVENWRTTSNDDSSSTIDSCGSGGPSGMAPRLFGIMDAHGVGKGAFAAQLPHTRSDVVIDTWFCKWHKPHHRNPPRFVHRLPTQYRLPDYRKLLLQPTEIAELDPKDAADQFDYLLANPLSSVIRGDRKRYLIVIDALGQAGGAGSDPLVEMLPRRAQRQPDWLGLVVTSRPEFGVTIALRVLKPLPLDAKSACNRADLGGEEPTTETNSSRCMTCERATVRTLPAACMDSSPWARPNWASPLHLTELIPGSEYTLRLEATLELFFALFTSRNRYAKVRTNTDGN